MTVSAINTTTASMLSAYQKELPPQGLLTSFYKVPAMGGIHNQEEIEFDRQIEDEVVATPVANSGSGYNENDFSGFDKDKVAPPVYKEAVSIPASKLAKLQPGQSIYKNVDFQVNGAQLVIDSLRKLQNKVKRSLELQASQIFTTGELDLLGEDGNSFYELDFGFDSGRFFNAATGWLLGGADPYNDILLAVRMVKNAKRVMMDSISFHAAMEVASFKAKFTFPQPGTGLGMLKPSDPQVPFETMFMGTLIVGAARLDMWVYDEGYKLLPGATKAGYIVANAIVMNDDRKDATFGGIPNFGNFQGSQRALNLPRRISDKSKLFDMTINSFIDRNEVLFVGVGTRPLLIPRNKESFATVHTLV